MGFYCRASFKGTMGFYYKGRLSGYHGVLLQGSLEGYYGVLLQGLPLRVPRGSIRLPVSQGSIELYDTLKGTSGSSL